MDESPSNGASGGAGSRSGGGSGGSGMSAGEDDSRRRGRDLDAEADELLNRIESQTGSMYAVHAGDDAEEFDPGNLHAGDLAHEGTPDDGLAHGIPLDEPPEGLEHDALASTGDQEPSSEEQPGKTAPRDHKGLKRALVTILVVLVLIICAVGVLVWHNNISPDAEQPDTEALVTSQAGTEKVDFQEIGADKVPKLTSVFGLKARAAKKKLGSSFQPSGAAGKSKDKRVKSMKKMLEGTWLDADGKAVANVGLGLDKKGRVVYAYALYNLDTIEVAQATFAELVMNNVVGTSVLEGIGVSKPELGTPQLAMDDSSKEEAKYRGKVGAKKAPKTWELAETYTYGSDNATTRTLLAELY